jgi:hypothetical protein
MIFIKATKKRSKILQNEAKYDKDLDYILNTTTVKLLSQYPKYKYHIGFTTMSSLYDLLSIGYFGLYPGEYFIKENNQIIAFVEFHEQSDNTVKAITLFDFNRGSKTNNDKVYPNIPDLADFMFKKYKEISWTTHLDDPAIVDYDEFIKKHNGTKILDGDYYRYCIKNNCLNILNKFAISLTHSLRYLIFRLFLYIKINFYMFHKYDPLKVL